MFVPWDWIPEEWFKIMENVRKGIVAKGKCDKWPEWKQDMIDHNVPDWYIWSCEKIKYMFPKAHAAAYVMMAWRIAYCKVFYPLAYYAAYFSIRATAFSYELMCQGKEKLEGYSASVRKAQGQSSCKKDSYRPGMPILALAEEWIRSARPDRLHFHNYMELGYCYYGPAEVRGAGG